MCTCTCMCVYAVHRCVPCMHMVVCVGECVHVRACVTESVCMSVCHISCDLTHEYLFLFLWSCMLTLCS